MADDERARILRMVSEGTLSPQEAADLIEALDDEPAPPPPHRPVPPAPPVRPVVRQSRVLVIQVRDGESIPGEPHTRVNLRIPLGLAKAATKFVPRRALDALKENGIDLDQFLDEFVQGEEIGPLIQIEDGSSRVLIAVE